VRTTLVWRCSCGHEIVEPGDGSQLHWALNHLKEGKRGGEAHKIVGLFDTATGEMLVEGFAHRKAVQLGILKPKNDTGPSSSSAPGPTDEEAEDERQARRGATNGFPRGGLSDAMQPSSQRLASGEFYATFKGLRLELPVWVLAYCALFMQKVRKPDGSRYEWRQQDVTDFLVDFLRTGFEMLLPLVLDLGMEAWQDIRHRQLLQTYIAAIEGIGDEELARMMLQGAARVSPEFAEMAMRVLQEQRRAG